MLLGLAVLDAASEAPIEVAVARVGRRGAVTYVTTEALPYREGALLAALGWKHDATHGTREEWSVDDDMGSANEAAVAAAENYLEEVGVVLARRRAPAEEQIMALVTETMRPLVARVVELTSRLQMVERRGEKTPTKSGRE